MLRTAWTTLKRLLPAFSVVIVVVNLLLTIVLIQILLGSTSVGVLKKAGFLKYGLIYRIIVLNSDLSALQDDVQSVQDDAQSVNDEELESRIEDVESRLEELVGGAEELESKIDELELDHNRQIEELEFDHEQRLDDLDSQINQLQY